MKPYAVIIGLDCITGLQAARILKRRGVPVIALAENPRHYCCRTNACDRILTAQNDELIGALEKLGANLDQKAVLFPCTDISVLLVSRHRDRLETAYHIDLPEPEVLETLIDKARFYPYAQAKGLPIPTTFFVRTRAQAAQASRRLTYPCILKPPMKTPRWEKNASQKAYRVAGAADLLALYDRCSDWAPVLMIQQWVEGSDADLYSCNCYFDSNSEPQVTFVARKLRQWPPRTGTSCLGQECRNDIVLEESIRLFRSLNYRGLGYVEMKQDRRTGKYYLIEPNVGRPTGRSAIAEAGGVELLYTKYCDNLGWELPPARRQAYNGVKWVYLRRDLQSALYYRRHKELSLRQWWDSLRGPKAFAVASLSDPLPFLYDLLRAFRFFRQNRNRASQRHGTRPKRPPSP